jgi:hypothetical protein
MVEQDELSQFLTADMFPAAPADPSAATIGDAAGERVLWQGLVAIAEFALEDGEYAPPRWSLPDTTEVTITDRRVAYAHVAPATAASAPRVWPPAPAAEQPHDEVTSGEIRWLWPQHLRVQPGTRAGNTPHEIHLVCGSTAGGWPALVLSGGDLKTVGDADRVANLLRRAITQFRLDNARRLEISTPKARMLSRLLLTPEFSNYLGGAGQTVSLPGALPLAQPADVTPPADVSPPPDVTPPPAEPAEWREPAAATPVAQPAPPAAQPMPEPPAERWTPKPPVEQWTPESPVEQWTSEPPVERWAPEPLVEQSAPEPVAERWVPEPPVERAPEPPVEPPTERPLTMEQAEPGGRTVELTLRPRRGAHAVDTDDLAARASSIAARVADLVNWNSGLTRDDPALDEPAPAPAAEPDWPVRPAAARFATNSGPIRTEIRRAVPNPGTGPASHGRHH